MFDCESWLDFMNWVLDGFFCTIVLGVWVLFALVNFEALYLIVSIWNNGEMAWGQFVQSFGYLCFSLFSSILKLCA